MEIKLLPFALLSNNSVVGSLAKERFLINVSASAFSTDKTFQWNVGVFF